MCTVLVCFAATGVITVAAQNVPPPKPPKTEVKPKPDKKADPPSAKAPEIPERPSQYYGRGTTEKAIAVDPNVNILIPCISEARVTVNGWQRDEIRVFIRNGSNVSFKVHEKSPKTGKPIWIVVRSLGPAVMPECLSGERIDIEVPFGAQLKVAGKKSDMQVDSVKKVEIENADGSVALRNVSGGIFASTYRGNIRVENSSGQIALKTTTGNVIAFEVGPGQVGDVFKAGTSSGSITLQKVDHRQIEAKSVSGEVVFNGKFLMGGIYSFETTDGAMRFLIPEDSSCRVVASYGIGNITSQLPMEVQTRDVSSGGKSLRAVIGDGDATLKLTTNNGNITIAKQVRKP